MTANPWVDRFDPIMPIDQLRARAEVRAEFVGDLAKEKNDEVAVHRIRNGLESVFLLTRQTTGLIRKLLGIARSFAMERYPNVRVYCERVYAEAVVPTNIPPVCITSLAGVGKTEALKALLRVVPAPSKISIPHHGEQVLEAAWMLTIRPGMRRALFETRNSPDGAMRRIDPAREMLTKGISLNIMDELQFMSSSGASALIVKTLLGVARLGPPLVYVANYSMVNRLWQRNQEETQRLLASPAFLDPDELDTDDWSTILDEWFKVAFEFRRLNAAAVGEMIHEYTFGIRRAAVRLLIIAFLCARRRGTRSVQPIDLQQAFLAPEYARLKADVEMLVKQRQTGERVDTGKFVHLWLDFPREAAPSARSQAEPARSRSKPLTEPSPEALLTKPGRRKLQSERANAKFDSPSSAASKTSRRSKATTDALLAGSSAFAANARKAVA